MKPVMEILEERKKLVEKDLDEADRSKIQAAELKERYEASLAVAEKEADCKARQQAQSEYERMMEQADQDARKKLQASEKTMELEREKVLNELRTSVTGLAMTAAARLLTEKNSPEWNKRQYDVFLAGEGEKND